MAINYTYTITDEQQRCLNDNLVDIQKWIDDAIAGKVNQCKKRMVTQWTKKLQEDPEIKSIPADADLMIAEVIARPDYKTRAERDAEEAALHEALMAAKVAAAAETATS